MKKNYWFFLILILGLAVMSCEDSTDPVPDTGTVYVESTPTGAQIWLDGVNTGEVTPGTIDASPGAHIVTLKLDGYGDLEFNVSVTAGEEFILTSGTTLSQLGSLIVQSEPAGATIILDGVNTGEVTPHTFSLADDNYTVVLQLTDYADSTEITQIANGGTATVSINLRPTFVTTFTTSFYESADPSSEHPSGLDLSSGAAISIKAGVNQDVDIFYNSDGFIVMSAKDRNGMTRETYFKVGNSTDIHDGINSPVKDNSWLTQIPDSETKYVFLYDADGHYSKFIIEDIEGGVPGVSAQLHVKWLYNDRENNTQF